MEPMAEGYDYIIDGDDFTPLTKGKEWKIEYTTTPDETPQLKEAVIYQAGHFYTFRDDKTADAWNKDAMLIVDAYKVGNY
jgi:hypothetical protein